MSSPLDLTSVLTIKNIENGYRRLRKKKKYKDTRSTDFPARYISVEEKEENALKHFLEDVVKTPEKRSLFYESLKNFKFDEFSAYAISKGAGKGFRPLLVPSPKDRLVFDALLPKYSELLKQNLVERKLLGIGLIKNQRVSDILHNVYDSYVCKGYHYALAIDYSSFFSNIDRKTLFRKLKKDFGDNDLISLLPTIVCNGVKNGQLVTDQTGIDILNNGIPQGLSFSPLLACYYALDIDDVYLSSDLVIGYRYIDDVVLYGKSEKDLRSIFSKIEKVSRRLKMKPHPLDIPKSKTELRNLNKDTITFLGVDISIVDGLHINEKKFDEFLQIVKTEIFPIRVLHQKNPEKIRAVYYSFVRGWLNHYEKISNDPLELHKKIDTLLYKKYFSKKQIRKRFYKKNTWILLSKNKEVSKAY